MSEAEWAVELVNGDVLVTIADDEDAFVYTLTPGMAAGPAIMLMDVFDAAEESNSGEHPTDD